VISKNRVKELALFLGLDEKSLRQMDKAVQDLPGYAKWINIAVADWDAKNIDQKRREQIERWFKTNDRYIFELSDVHSRRAKQKIIRQVIKICKKQRVRTFLDYGGGIGEEAILAAKAGMKAWMADLPCLTFDFARWRAKYHGVKVHFIKIEGDHPLTKKYDAIVCFEVLQHLFDVEAVVRHLVASLNPQGLLFITTRFKNPGYPIALKANLKYDEGMVKFFTKEGLRLIDKIHQYGKGERAKYLYVYQKPK